MIDDWGHSLKALYQSLNDNDRTAIRNEVETQFLDNYSFEDGLEILDHAFEYWRYLHEKPDFGMGIRAINTVLKVMPAFLKAIRKHAKKRWEDKQKTKELSVAKQ